MISGTTRPGVMLRDMFDLLQDSAALVTEEFG
jgi:hypothetical protein